jgi:hypothetical protein
MTLTALNHLSLLQALPDANSATLDLARLVLIYKVYINLNCALSIRVGPLYQLSQRTNTRLTISPPEFSVVLPTLVQSTPSLSYCGLLIRPQRRHSRDQ